MSSRNLKKKRDRMWSKDPHCEKCGILTVLPSALPQKVNPNNGCKQMKHVPDNMATIQHKYSRNHPLRLVPTVERRWFLWCYRCNHEDADREMEELYGNKSA